MNLTDLMRLAIAIEHDAIEKTPYSIAMMNGSINRREYLNGLAQLWYVHLALEHAFAEREAVNAFFQSTMIRSPAIARDVQHFGCCIHQFAKLPETTTVETRIQRWNAEAPFALLGLLYVMEGSRMGSLVLAKPLAKALKLEPGKISGIEYHLENAQIAPAQVRSLKEKINTADFDTQSKRQVIMGATETMALLLDLYSKLPVDGGGSASCEDSNYLPRCA